MSVEEVTTEIETRDNLEEAVKLIIHPYKNVPRLFSFIAQLQGILVGDDIRGTIVSIAGCFNHSTLIALMVPTQNISNLVINLALMRNVTKVLEDTPETFAFSSLHNSIRIKTDSSVAPSKTLHLILENELSP